MTYSEYTRKRNSIAISDAPVSVKATAIEQLDAKFNTNPSKEALQQIAESAPDIPKLGDN